MADAIAAKLLQEVDGRLESLGPPSCSCEEIVVSAPSHSPLDIAWVLVCAALVMLMQAGFSCLESGLARSKNSINVAIKNFIDFCISSVVFWLWGYAVMFGDSLHGLFGTTGFCFDNRNSTWLLTFFLF